MNRYKRSISESSKKPITHYVYVYVCMHVYIGYITLSTYTLYTYMNGYQCASSACSINANVLSSEFQCRLFIFESLV